MKLHILLKSLLIIMLVTGCNNSDGFIDLFNSYPDENIELTITDIDPSEDTTLGEGDTISIAVIHNIGSFNDHPDWEACLRIRTDAGESYESFDTLKKKYVTSPYGVVTLEYTVTDDFLANSSFGPPYRLYIYIRGFDEDEGWSGIFRGKWSRTRDIVFQ